MRIERCFLRRICFQLVKFVIWGMKWAKGFIVHYKTFACRMTIFHYFLSKQIEKGFLGYLNVFIYSNEHFYLSQSEKNCQKVKNLLILGHFSKIKKNWENGKNEKKIKFLFYSFFSQIMLVKYIYFQSSYSFWHKTAQK